MIGPRVDMGADEFLDTDIDRLPDWWEQKYFGSAIAGDAFGDEDGDVRTNVNEYAASANPSQTEDEQ